MATKRQKILCFDDRKGGSRSWLEIAINGEWRDGSWWNNGRRFSDYGGLSCPSPNGQTQMRAAMRRRKISDPNKLIYPSDTGGVFEYLDGVGASKGMVSIVRPLPAVDIDDEPRPAPRPGLKLCDCGLPVIPGTDMCRRCALLDYGTTSKSILPRKAGRRRRRRFERQDVISVLRNRPEGATLTEILGDLHEDTSKQSTARNTLQILFDRWIPKSEGRIVKEPCIRRGNPAVCYHLDAPRRRSRRHR